MVEENECWTSCQGERKAVERPWQGTPQRTRETAEVKKKKKIPHEPLKEFAGYSVYSWLHDELAEHLEKVEGGPQHRQFVDAQGVCVGLTQSPRNDYIVDPQ